MEAGRRGFREGELLVVGWRFSDLWQGLYTHSVYHQDDTKDINQVDYFLGRRTWDDFTLTLGGGVFDSELKKNKLSLIVQLKWTYSKGPGLF